MRALSQATLILLLWGLALPVARAEDKGFDEQQGPVLHQEEGGGDTGKGGGHGSNGDEHKQAEPQQDPYLSSCKECYSSQKQDGTELSCSCRAGDGSWKRSALLTTDQPNGRQCSQSSIYNLNGSLACVYESVADGGGGGTKLEVPDFTQFDNMKFDFTTGVNTKVDTSRADNWNAKHYNDNMFKNEANSLQQFNNNDGKNYIQQNESYYSHSNVLFGCANTSLYGRSDSSCASASDDPECVGVMKSLENATHCEEPPPPGSPPGTPCLQYGKHGFVMEEWLVFGQQFYNGMASCVTMGSGANEKAWKMLNLATMADLTVLGASPGTGATSSSTITGKIEQQPDPAALNAKAKSATGTEADKSAASSEAAAEAAAAAVAKRYDDGASHLGYEKGKVIHLAARKVPFSQVFSDSPFAEQLGQPKTELVVGSLDQPDEIVERVREKKVAMRESREKAAEEGLLPEQEERTEGTLAGGPSRSGGWNAPPAGGSPSQISGAGRSDNYFSPGELKALEAYAKEKLGASWQQNGEAVARGAGIPPGAEPAAEPGSRAPASALAAEASLFERVRLSYRRHEPRMRESQTAHDVRHTELPGFFRGL